MRFCLGHQLGKRQPRGCPQPASFWDPLRRRKAWLLPQPLGSLCWQLCCTHSRDGGMILEWFRVCLSGRQMYVR